MQLIEVQDATFVLDTKIRQRIEKAQNDKTIFVIAKTNEIEIGFLCYENWPNYTNGYIYEIFVQDKYRRNGVGQKLLMHSDCLAKKFHHKSIKVKPFPLDRQIDKGWLISWYAKYGYKRVPDSLEEMEKFL